MQNEPDRLIDEATREVYQHTMLELRGAFEQGGAGGEVLRGRAAAVDNLVRTLWQRTCEQSPMVANGVALVAVGGYGRRELFPCSDVDLMFLLDSRASTSLKEQAGKDSIRRINQALWDCGLRVAPVTRKLKECDRFNASNAEFTLSLLNERLVAGDQELYERFSLRVLPKALRRDRAAIIRRLTELTAARHAKYGGTLFHLEPNIKDCPGGLRDVHVCGWTAQLLALRSAPSSGHEVVSNSAAASKGAHSQAGLDRKDKDDEFIDAIAFLQRLRCFLHFKHDRDDNTLDWQAQDAAAAAAVGLDCGSVFQAAGSGDVAYWMRLYFRNARVVKRKVTRVLEAVSSNSSSRLGRLAGYGTAGLGANLKLAGKSDLPAKGFVIEQNAVVFAAAGDRAGAWYDPAHDPETVLAMFEAMASNNCRLGVEAEARLSQALPLLSADLEEGPALWRHIETILTGRFAGNALRAMHALGILELLVPEFHGIDALVIRDAYHRYTVDEHTFVLIDTLHNLERSAPAPLPTSPVTRASASRASIPHKLSSADPLTEWSSRFGQLLRDLQQPGLLYLMALLHDTGKGRSTGDHAQESARMAENVLSRLELDGYESRLVVRLIASHLEMSAALRRDIFDTDTVRGFAAKIQAPEALRMLSLFTYADIQAVHPDALTPWKAEDLWRLYLATSNFLDRNIDEERFGAKRENELVLRVVATMPERRVELEQFFEGLPARYLSTRSPEQVQTHFELSTRFASDPVQLDLHYSPAVSEITLVTRDRPALFANMAGALAAWGMNIVTADAFSNREGTVLDSFRFTDPFRTLELNASERDRFVASVRDVMMGIVPVETLLHGHHRGNRKPPMVKVEARVDFDDVASAHSTLLQVVAQDTPGLLRVLSLTLAASQCNIEVALVDTEGEMAIDVFYVTREHTKLGQAEQMTLRRELIRAIEQHQK